MQIKILLANIVLILVVSSCNKDTEGPSPLTGDITLYSFSSTATLEGTVEFAKRSDNSTQISIDITGGSAGDSYPAFLNLGTAADSKGILLVLTTVENGESISNVATLNDGSPITYDQLIDYDGNISIHKSNNDLGTIILFSDIGQNALTGKEIIYEIPSISSEGISGMATFFERKNGSTLVTIQMTGTAQGVNHATHIHQGNALDGGSIVISFANISGEDGLSQTNISKMDDGTDISYTELLDFNGHIVVHPGQGQFDILAKGDMGQNQLTGTFEEYQLSSQSQDNISGKVVFRQRKNNNTLIEMELTGTTPGANHATHIHQNTMLAGGSIEISFQNVEGNTGVSRSNITTKNDGTAITYDELINYDGHVVVHPNRSQFSIVARGDVGKNVLTGVSKEYAINANGGTGVSGIVTFYKRKSGLAFIQVEVTGTQSGNSHPNHIHENNVAMGGPIVLSFNPIDGATGISKTDATKFDDGTAVTYDELMVFNGHVVVHHQQTFAAIAKGDIGSNSN